MTGQPSGLNPVQNKDAPRDKDFVRDNDSLYVMPLQIVPFSTSLLRRGRLIRNTLLKPAIEVYSSGDGISGQILIEDITPELGQHNFGWSETEIHPDYKTIRKLAQLTSYDIYSLRILFRELEIPLESVDYLTLSPEKKRQLNGYMRTFTRPLVKHIYGDAISDDLDAGNIIKLFTDPDTANALSKLEKLADLLKISIDKIPTFLEDFADIYMSFSYYQEYFDDIIPKVMDLVKEIGEMKKSWQFKQDRNLQLACNELILDLNDLTVSTSSRFELFYKNTEKMWEDISAERFRETETMIRSYHTTIGGVLCGLGIKLNTWKTRFPSPDVGGPQARTELILSSMKPGMEIIRAIDKAAPRQPDIAQNPAQKNKRPASNPHAA